MSSEEPTPRVSVNDNTSTSPLSAQSTGNERMSFEGSVNLNDDLAAASEYSSGIVPNNRGRRSGSYMSHKTSIDGESTFSSSAYFNILNNHNVEDGQKSKDTFSPLGPNSIYELTIGSDTARSRRNQTPKTSITLNGGNTIVNNIRTPTIKDIPQIQLSKLSQKVHSEELRQSLVNELTDEYKNFESSYKLLTEDTLQKFIAQEKHHNRNDSLSSGNVSRSSSVSNLKGLLEHAPDSDDKDVKELIPEVYLDPEFRLDDPRIFAQVIEGCKILPDADEDVINESHLAVNTVLQDKLSHYLDIVEIKLIKEISKSSDSFFNTLGDIQDVSSQSEACIDKFHEISAKLEALELNQAQTGLQILSKLDERKNVEHLEAAILQIQYILSIFELAKKSFQNGLHNKCLTEIILVENLIKGIDTKESDEVENGSINLSFDQPLSDLTTLPALQDLKIELVSLKTHCSKGYINDFVELLLSDLRDHCKSVSSQQTLDRIAVSINGNQKGYSSKINRSYQVLDENKKASLKDFIENLFKAGHITDAYSNYQTKIINEIKDIIKVNLPSSRQGYSSVDLSEAPSRSSPMIPDSANSSSGNSSSGTNSLSSNIRAMSPKEFEGMMTKIYTTLSECLRRLTVHQKILLDLALTAMPPSGAQDMDVMSLDITVAINKAIELTQIRLTKILNVRSEQTADLTVPFYLRFYSLSSAYLQECEFINPGYVASGPGSSLNDWVKNHVGYFIHRFHSNCMKAASRDCDREIWKEVTDSALLSQQQSIVNELISHAEYIDTNGSTGFSGKPWLKPLDLVDHSEDPASSPQDGAEEDPAKYRLAVAHESFMVPTLVTKVLKNVRDYIIIAKVFPSKSHNIEVDLLSLFKLINSKTSQSVLNAGATRTAGLKHITTKHLALCIQFVEFNIAFLTAIEHIFKFSKSNSSGAQQPNPAFEEPTFVGIISNFRDHENELFSKLVSIMYDRTLIHCQKIVQIDWSQPLTHPQQCHPYMETLVKETSTVTKVLSKYLPEGRCAMIMSQIFDNYKKLLVNCLCTQLPQFNDFNEKHSLLKDIDYFRVKLCESPGYGTSGQVIWENVNSLPTIEDAKMEAIMRNNIAGEQKGEVARVRNSASLDLKRDSRNSSRESLIEKVVKPQEKDVVNPLATAIAEAEPDQSKFDLSKSASPASEAEKPPTPKGEPASSDLVKSDATQSAAINSSDKSSDSSKAEATADANSSEITENNDRTG